MKSTDSPPIFVIGTGRSGTTLLRLMLNAHPRIHLTHEAGFFHSAHSAGKHKSPLDWFRIYSKTMSYRWLKLNTPAIENSIPATLPRSQISQVFSHIMRAKAKQHGKVRIGDKTPYHALRIKEILAAYPQAKIIYVVRDPREVVASLTRMPWATKSTTMAAIYCHLVERAVAPYQKKIHTVRLEDLLTNKEPSLRQIFGYLEEPWDDSVLEHERHLIPDDVPPAPWLQSSRTQTSHHHKSPTSLDAASMRNIEWICQSSFRLHGYIPAEMARQPSRLKCIINIVKDLPEAVRVCFRLSLVSALTKGSYLISGEQAMSRYLNLNPDAWQHYPKSTHDNLLKETFSEKTARP